MSKTSMILFCSHGFPLKRSMFSRNKFLGRGRTKLKLTLSPHVLRWGIANNFSVHLLFKNFNKEERVVTKFVVHENYGAI